MTHREVSSGVAFVTGHEDGSLDWDALAAFPGTLVFYMGVKALPTIASRLVAGGRPASQPVAVVERGTLPGPEDRRLDAGRRGRGRGGHPRAGDHAGGRRRGAARADRVAGVAAAVRAHRRGHARPRAGVGAWRSRLRDLGRGGGRGAGDPDAAAGGLVAAAARLRPAVRDLAERRGRAVPAPARRARPGRGDGRGDRPGHGAGAARARASSRTSCPRARSPRAWSRRWRTCRSSAR